jgi:rfaE bifunctional protein kinase chain/domain
MTIKDLMRVRKKTRVLVVGDIMVDQYTKGRPRGISQEAPVAVLRYESEKCVLGGAANVAANLAAIGVNTEIFGMIGDDSMGRTATVLLKNRGIKSDGMITDLRRVTTTKQRIWAGQQIVRIDREDETPLAPSQVMRMAEQIEQRLDKVNAVIISDYGKGAVTPELTARIATACQNRDVFLALNAKPSNHRAIPHNLSVLIVNRREAFEISGLKEDGKPSTIEAAALSLHHRYAPRLVMITLGGEGILLYRESCVSSIKPFLRVPTTPSEVIDVSGCGDTVVAFFVLGAALGYDHHASAKLANKAAGVVIKKFGTAVVNPDDLSD